MRALVTGAGGFAGSHLADHLVAVGDEVVALSRDNRCPANLVHLHRQMDLIGIDLLEADAVRETFAEIEPDVIYHLAALSSPAMSNVEPVRVVSENTTTTAAVLYAALACRKPPRVLLVTTSDMYGLPASGTPLDESTPLAPPNAYAVSKVAAHYLAQQVWRTHGLPIVEARPFNHIGPRQEKGFVVPDFTSQLVAVKRTLQPPRMRVGDLRNGRDFTDVRDVVRGYRLAATAGRPGEVYHFCRGQSVTMEQLLDQLIAKVKVMVAVETDPSRIRPEPPSVIVGTAAKAAAELGWSPEISLDQTLDEVVAEWRERQA